MALTVISLKWVHREVHGKPPSPRQGHTACVIGETAYIFGGIRSVDWPKKGTYFFRDLHQLHLYKRMQWEKVRQKGDIPKGRYGHHMCVVGKKIYLFGGKHELQADHCLPGVHVFDTESRIWSDVQTSGTEPVAHSSTSGVVGKRIYIFGGLVEGQATDDLFCFDTESRWWVKLTVTGVPPSPRCDSACTAVGNKLYLFAGTGGPDVWFNDLHVFDTEKLLWTQLNRAEGDPPPARGNHSFVAHSDKDIYLFGGTNDSNTSQPTYGDLYKFSLDKHKWKRPFYGGCPPARRSGHTAVIHKNKLIITGGCNEDTDFNDVHIAKLINPSKRQPLKVSANDMHEFLSSINSPEPSTQAPPSNDPSEGHFHEKPEPEPAPLESPESGASPLPVDNEGSIASVGSSLSQGKTVHFEDQDEEGEEGQDSARSASSSASSSSSSTASSATSLSSQASSSTASSDAISDPDEGSPGSNNNNNNNMNNNNRTVEGVPSMPRVFQREEDEKMSGNGVNLIDRVAGTQNYPLRPGVDKEVQVTGLDTPGDGSGMTPSQAGAENPSQFGMQQPPMQQSPEAMAAHNYPMSGFQQQQQHVGGDAGGGGFPQQQLQGEGGYSQQLGGGGGGGGGYPWQQPDQHSPGARHPPPLTRGSTVSDFRFMQGQPLAQPMQSQYQPLAQPVQSQYQPMALPVQSQPIAEENEEEEEEEEESGSESESESDDGGDDGSMAEVGQRSNSGQETESDMREESEDESDSEEEDEDEEDDDEDEDEDDEDEEEEDEDGSESDSSDESDGD